MNDDTAATLGEGLSRGSRPSSWVTCTRAACSASLWTSRAAAAAVALDMPMLVNMLASSRSSSAGCRSISSRSLTHSRSSCSFWVFTDVYSPMAIEKAPATRPATPVSTMKLALAPAAPTPATSAMLVTRPSMPPNTEARSAPPDTSAWVWPTSATPVLIWESFMRKMVDDLLTVDNLAKAYLHWRNDADLVSGGSVP